MSADVLRRAADLMRERADATMLVTDEGGLADWHTPADLLGMFDEAGDADHVASWSPDVALAVAAWLAWCARYDAFNGRALAVARAYLGESA